MTINTTQIANLLRPGLSAVFGDYPSYPAQYTEIFERYESDKAFEQEVEMKFLGLAQIRAEGLPTVMDSMGQRSITTYLHRYVSLGFTITRQAMLDNLYKTRFPMMAKSLRRSMMVAKDTLGAAVLNNGFTTQLTGDGVSLFNLNHPIDGGVVANTSTVAMALNEASLESAIVGVQQFLDVAGLRCMVKPQKLIVPPQLQFTAERILASSFRTGTNNNDIGAIYNITAVPQGYRVNQYLTSPLNFFLTTDASDGFKLFQREDVETDVYTDFSTDNLLCKSTERYSFGVSNFRAAYGVQGV